MFILEGVTLYRLPGPGTSCYQAGLDRDQALRGARILGCDPGLQRSMGIGASVELGGWWPQTPVTWRIIPN